MRILHVLFQFPGETGSGVFINNLIREGAKKGHTQGLTAAIETGMNYENPNLDYTDLVRFQTDELPFPMPGMSDIMPYPSSKYGELDQVRLKVWKSAFKKAILKAYKEFQPDVILANHLWIGTSMIAIMLPETRIMAICHSTDIRQLQNNPGYRDYVLNGCDKLNHIFALSEGQKELIIENYGISSDKISVTGGGFNSDIFHSENRQEHNGPSRLIYAGKLSRSKGLLPLIEAYRRISSEMDVELSLAGSGSGDEASEIIEYAEKTGVNILGAVPQRVLGELFRASDIFILPSYYEGLPLVLLEALACGLPAVVTDISGLKEFFGEKAVKTGLVEFIPLPKMLGTDIPDNSAIEKFTDDLSIAIKKQIRLLHEGYISFAPLKQVFNELSWEKVFERIEKYL